MSTSTVKVVYEEKIPRPLQRLTPTRRDLVRSILPDADPDHCFGRITSINSDTIYWQSIGNGKSVQRFTSDKKDLQVIELKIYFRDGRYALVEEETIDHHLIRYLNKNIPENWFFIEEHLEFEIGDYMSHCASCKQEIWYVSRHQELCKPCAERESLLALFKCQNADDQAILDLLHFVSRQASDLGGYTKENDEGVVTMVADLVAVVKEKFNITRK